MPAPSLSELYQFEKHIAAAWAARIKAGAGGIQVFTPAVDVGQRTSDSAPDDFKLDTPRIEIVYENGAPTGSAKIVGGYKRLRAWSGSLVTRCITTRFKNGGAHHAMLALARIESACFQNVFTPTELPWHQVAQMLETGSSMSIDEEGHYDITEVRFGLVVNIRDDAWPA